MARVLLRDRACCAASAAGSRVHVVAEGKLGKITAVKRNEDAAQKPAEQDAAIALVRGQAVGLRPADS